MTMSEENKKVMQYVRLGESGLKVSKVILGCMSYGTPEWQSWVLEEEEGIKHIEHAYKAGINTFDTANVYSNGASEVVLGKALKKIGAPRSNYVVLTKLFFICADTPSEGVGITNLPGKYVNRYGLSRKNIFASVKASLERLQLDHVDVIQCHRFDYETPIAETMQALHDVVQAGYARYIGMSSCYGYQLQKMQNYAISHNLTPFVSMQNFHNAVYREEEREMMPTLKEFGMGCIPWSPINLGFLARPHKGGETERSKGDTYKQFTPQDPMMFEINERVEKVAKDRGASMAQVAVAWSISNDFITAPIVGSTNIAHLDDSIAAIHLKLTEKEIKYINEPYRPRAVLGNL